MNTRSVLGKRIVKVEHRRFYNSHLRRMETVVERIRLDDGSVLVPFATEAEDGPIATIFHGRVVQQKRYQRQAR